ncbi:MAG: hypothetical protein A2V70_18920, partial [Planctomycetes bacterium RBG_13_63_9]
RTVERLLCPEPDAAAQTPAEFNRAYDGYEASASGSNSADGLRAWWLRRMIQSPHPLLEKMTLFWHGHFATSNVRVNDARLIGQHVRLLRKHALGSYEQLLEEVSHDPAVFVSLDAGANRKALPSEHYARALMDPFSLGPGGFAEEDIGEIARAFTGWFVLRSELRYIAREHDSGVKRVLGRQGDFDGKDVVRILLEQPAAPRLVVRKLYRWLISEAEEPDEKLIEPLAEAFAKDYDVAKLLGTMLRSNLFYGPVAYRRRIKSPVEFALGIVRTLEGLVSTMPLGQDLAALGQNLYHPPTVKGWQGGRSWIHSATLIGRGNLARALLTVKGPYGEGLDPAAVAKRHGHSDVESAGRFLLDLFLQGDVPSSVRDTLLQTVMQPAGGDDWQRLRQLAHGVATLPEFQLG